jgi:hypothetical protein
VISPAGKRTLVAETERTVEQVEALADVVYDDRDVGACTPPPAGYVVAGGPMRAGPSHPS